MLTHSLYALFPHPLASPLSFSLARLRTSNLIFFFLSFSFSFSTSVRLHPYSISFISRFLLYPLCSASPRPFSIILSLSPSFILLLYSLSVSFASSQLISSLLNFLSRSTLLLWILRQSVIKVLGSLLCFGSLILVLPQPCLSSTSFSLLQVRNPLPSLSFFTSNISNLLFFHSHLSSSLQPS